MMIGSAARVARGVAACGANCSNSDFSNYVAKTINETKEWYFRDQEEMEKAEWTRGKDPRRHELMRQKVPPPT